MDRKNNSSDAGASPLVAGQTFRTMAGLVGLRAISPETAADGLTKAADTIDALIAALIEIDTVCTESASACRKRMGTRVGNALTIARAAITAAEGK